MERASGVHSSKVPEHLRPFFRPTITTEPKAQYSYHSPVSTSQISTPELCPPHWRLVPKRTLRETLKDIVLKNWQGSHRRKVSSSLRNERVLQPLIMRMKDSDDYITARAANPRTGVISPSIGATTPRLCTPETPGEALELCSTDGDPLSPTVSAKLRPTLQRANESRRINTENANKCRAEERRWNAEHGITLTSPRIAHIKADASRIGSKSRPSLNDDKFIVRMPSAHEPQPYAYPGCSSKQIEALERYKDNTRRVSGAGSGTGVPHGISAELFGRQGTNVFQNGARQILRSDSPGIRVPKKRGRTFEKENCRDDGYCCGETNIDTTHFAPLSSSRTPLLATALPPSTAWETLPAETEHSIHRKAVSAAVLNLDTAYEDSDTILQHPIAATTFTDLRDLPRVTLVHPACAGKPHPRQPRQVDRSCSGIRQCSLGCYKDPETRVCVEGRVVSNSATQQKARSLFDHQRNPTGTEEAQVRPSIVNETESSLNLAPQLSEIMLAALISMAQACKKVPLPPCPQIGVFDVLYAEDTTPQEKVSALKSMLSSAGQVVIVLTILTMLWHLGSLVAHVLEMLLWPFMVPLKVLRWLRGVS